MFVAHQKEVFCTFSAAEMTSPEVNSVISIHFFSGKTDSQGKVNPGQVVPQMSSCSANPVISVTQAKALGLPSVFYDPFLESHEGMKIFSTSSLIYLPLVIQKKSFQKLSREVTPD